MCCVEEESDRLFIARRDGAVDFEAADHALDGVAFLVDACIPVQKALSIGPRWDDRLPIIAGAPYQHFVAKTDVLRWVPRVEC